MAENKNSFLLYADLIHTVSKLSDENAGLLLKTILAYVNDLDPIINNDYVDLVFEPIKHRLKKDLVKWETSVNQKSNSGKIGNLKRWHPELYKKYMDGKIDLEQAVLHSRELSHRDVCNRTESQNVANIAVNVNDNVNVSVNDNVIIEKEVKEKAPAKKAEALPEYEEFLAYGLSKKPNASKEQLRAKYDYWVLLGWKTGKGTPIKNWKATLTNTLPHIEEAKNKTQNNFRLSI